MGDEWARLAGWAAGVDWERLTTLGTLAVVAVAKLLFAAILPGTSPAARAVGRMTATIGWAYALALLWALAPRLDPGDWPGRAIRVAVVWTTLAAIRLVVRERGGWRAVGRDVGGRWAARGRRLRARVGASKW